MTSTADAKRAVQETIKQLGGIDIIIANAVCIFLSPSTRCSINIYFCISMPVAN